jgi:hypothetical protein
MKNDDEVRDKRVTHTLIYFLKKRTPLGGLR